MSSQTNLQSKRMKRALHQQDNMKHKLYTALELCMQICGWQWISKVRAFLCVVFADTTLLINSCVTLNIRSSPLFLLSMQTKTFNNDVTLKLSEMSINIIFT